MSIQRREFEFEDGDDIEQAILCALVDLNEGRTEEAVAGLTAALALDAEPLAISIVNEALSLIAADLISDAQVRLNAYARPRYASEEECAKRYRAAMLAKRAGEAANRAAARAMGEAA